MSCKLLKKERKANSARLFKVSCLWVLPCLRSSPACQIVRLCANTTPSQPSCLYRAQMLAPVDDHDPPPPSPTVKHHLKLPRPLEKLTVPKAVENDPGTVLVGISTDGELSSKCGCCMLWRRRRHAAGPAAASQASTSTQPAAVPGVRIAATSTTAASAATVTVQFQGQSSANGPSAAKLASESPVLKGVARSPFAGLRSVSREGPGRLVRRMTGGRTTPAKGTGTVAFSLHA